MRLTDDQLMKRFLLLALAICFSSSIPAKTDERIYITKDICGRYYAAEINGGEAAKLLSLKNTGRVSSRVEQYCNFFR